MSFTDTLLTWYEAHKRDLPWRGEQDPYKIWVSEIILQQTRVQQGWNYYLRFIREFPTLTALAEASEEQVLKVWQGLGYYSRARNMHHAARQVMKEFNGVFPHQYKEIRKLKGIGDYTAAAIGSMAFRLPYPAIDGNVFRIICRIFGIFDNVTLPATKIKITDLCNRFLDRHDPGRFNQAVMDFGAIHCTPRNPHCESCPFQTDCYAYKHDAVANLPVKSVPAAKKERFFHYTFYIFDNQTIIEKRVHKDIWHNLYQFPLIETDSLEKRPWPADPEIEIDETLTHQIIHAHFYIKEIEGWPVLNSSQQVVEIARLCDYPMPKIMIQFLKKREIS